MDTILDELKEKYGAQLALRFQPIDFSNIPGFPNCCDGSTDVYHWLPIFYGDYGESAICHVKYFLQLMADSNILHEDNMMESLLVLFGVRPVVGSIRAFLINV